MLPGEQSMALEPSRVAHQSDPRNRAADQPALYDVDTRCILRNDQEVADRSSRMDLIEDDDKGVTIDIGPWLRRVASRKDSGISDSCIRGWTRC